MKKSLLGFNLIFLGLFSSFIFTSCSSSKKVGKSEGEVVVNVEKSDKLENQSPKKKVDKIMIYLGDESVAKWKLVTLNSQKAVDLYNNLPVMRFDEPWKQIYGTTGCNKFTAYYIKEDNLLAISRVSATELQCDNSNESLFLDALKNIDEIKEEDSVLSLLSSGQEILIFERY
jgi:heat shock protein HslJ